MKKFLLILFISIIVLATGIIFFPRKVENAVVIKCEKNYTQIYVKDKVKKFQKNLKLKPGTTINYYYNQLSAFNINVSSPITERIMTKKSTSFDFELSGSKTLSKKTYYYKISKDGKLSLCKNSEIVLGENNVDSYKNSKGNFNVFVIHPFNYSNVRIGISTNGFNSIFHQKIKISSLSTMNLYSKSENYSLDIPSGQDITIEKIGGQINIISKDLIRNSPGRFYLKGNSMYLNGLTRGIPSFTPEYNGVLEFNPGSKGFTIVNEVNIEDYLTKVVPSEMPEMGGVESLKCQAIAARTYAIASMKGSIYEDKGFYMDDSTQSQVYNNMKAQSLASEAIKATAGLIMTYKDTPMDAKYYSTSGGSGSDYKSIWFNADGTSESKPYFKVSNYLNDKKELPVNDQGWLTFYKATNLKAIDSISPYFRWKVEYSAQGITTCLNNSLKILYEKRKDYVTILKSDSKGKDFPVLKNLKDIKIKSRGPAGNVKEIYFVFSNAQISVRQDSSIRSAFRCSKSFTGENTVIMLNDGNGLSGSSFLPSSFFSIEQTQDGIVLYGGGYGHGVGMSQYGAMEMSKQGSSYTDILNIYYKNFKLKKIY